MINRDFPNHDVKENVKAGWDFPNHELCHVIIRKQLHLNFPEGDFPDHDKQSHYGLQNNYIRDFPNHDVQCWTRLDRFSVAHIPNIDKQSIKGFRNHDVFSKTIPFDLKQLHLNSNNCISLKTKVTMVNEGRSRPLTLLILVETLT